jgi:hypothetical protein
MGEVYRAKDLRLGRGGREGSARKWPPGALLLMIIVSIASPTHARAAVVGALLGVGRQGISGDAPPNTSYGARGGLIAGVQGEITLSPGIALSVQPRLAQRRTTLTSVDDVTGEKALDLNLFSVPVLLKFSAAGGRTYFAGGLDVGFLRSAHLTGDGLDEDIQGPLPHGRRRLFGFGVVFRGQATSHADSGRAGPGQSLQRRCRVRPQPLHPTPSLRRARVQVGILFPLGGAMMRRARILYAGRIGVLPALLLTPRKLGRIGPR